VPKNSILRINQHHDPSLDDGLSASFALWTAQLFEVIGSNRHLCWHSKNTLSMP